MKDSIEQILDFKSLKKNLKLPAPKEEIKVALLGDSSTQFLKTAIQGYGYQFDIRFNIYEGDYDQINQEVFNTGSSLYSFNPEIIILFHASEKLLYNFNEIDSSERINFANKQVEHYGDIYNTLQNNIHAKIVFFNFPLINASIYGNLATKVESSFRYQLAIVNYKLMEFAASHGNFFIYDLEQLQSQIGIEQRISSKFYYNSQFVLSLEILPRVGKELIEIILAIKGKKLNKCLILDLDNTTWGGVIGDDGMEGIQIGELGIGKVFSELQQWAKELKKRGIIICICSKNTDSVAKEPFEKHPDMKLRLEDISVFVANWENKADNIRYIKEVLNIGYDSMVFIDDNPFERNLVRTELKEVFVPELPSDPAEYLNYLRSLNLFETASYSQEDSKRTLRYQEEAKRIGNKKSYKSISDYLKSLEMGGELIPFEKFSIPRIAQLTQRSNQFNLRTIRYTEEEISNVSNSDEYQTYQLKLKDKYGDYGLVSVVIGKMKEDNVLFIETWIMSCRVLKRDVEKFVLNVIVEECRKQGISKIVGEWIETKKNIIVKDHYKNLGFIENENVWVLDVETYEPHINYIEQLSFSNKV